MRFPLLLAGSVIVFVGLALLGGGGQALDTNVIAYFVGWRAAHPALTSALVAFTQLGGAPVLLGLTLLGGPWLVLRRRLRTAASLIMTVSLGRLGVELLKLTIDRPRPSFDAHPVVVFSQSFPSGHAANSMITYTALAVFLCPAQWRRVAVSAAIGLALAIGATRPVLGVHWPSDVLGGWLFGLAVVSLGSRWQWSERSEA